MPYSSKEITRRSNHALYSIYRHATSCLLQFLSNYVTVHLIIDDGGGLHGYYRYRAQVRLKGRGLASRVSSEPRLHREKQTV